MSLFFNSDKPYGALSDDLTIRWNAQQTGIEIQRLAGDNDMEHNKDMPAPVMQFEQFAHPQRWWLRRGPPPWLDDPRWWVRAFRTSMALGVMGTITGWLTVVGLFLVGLLDRWLVGLPSWFSELAFGVLCGPGFWFGVGVLIPLSRWLGRSWIFSLLSVPASMFACYCGVMTLFLIDPIMGQSPDWVPFEDSGSFFAGFVGAAIVSLWMGNPLKKSAWLAGLTASILASIGCGVLPWMEQSSTPHLRQFGDLLQFAGPYVTFQSLAAIGLGVRLWWDRQHSSS